MISKDIATTVLGGVMAVATASQPVINGVNGSFHQADFVSLVLAVTMSLFGYFTNKGSKSDQ